MNLPSDFLPGLVGFLLTVMVLSYLIGDSALFRFAAYIFVGVSAGYVAVIAFAQVILPNLIQPLTSAGTDLQKLGMALVPLFLGVLILMKISPQLSWLGGPAVGYLAGVGAAVAISGAVLGTIIPQVEAASKPFDIAGLSAQGFSAADSAVSIILGAFMLVGAVSTLAYFQFGARRLPDGSVKRNAFIAILAWVGQLFVAVTFGVLF
ncbi:MAG: hypothetical protein AB1750_09445, partial [Chloroflexota bacterium]